VSIKQIQAHACNAVLKKKDSKCGGKHCIEGNNYVSK
jgi:hypothetical protein